MRDAYMKAILIVIGLVLAAGVVVAKEQPGVVVQPNAPGWITINYTHSGTGGVIGYYIERQETGIIFSSVAPSGQLIDTHLKPDTQYAYRACAVYADEEKPECSPFIPTRTLPAQGKPRNYDPPLVQDVGIDIDRITVTWGAVGEYTNILLRLDDAGGNLGQWEVRSLANGSFTFRPLKPNTTYHIILKGCTNNPFSGHSCGPWSPRFTFTTFGPVPPPPPPGKPTLTLSGTTDSTVSLAWQVKVLDSYPGDRARLYRDGRPYKELEARSALNGLQGTYTDTVQERHAYQVCFERDVISVQVCSDRVLDPLIRSRAEAEIVTGFTKKLDKDAAVQPDVSVAGPSFAGDWDTVTSGGASYRMVLVQSGGQVSGTYEPSSGTITGTSITRAPDGGSVITFVWAEGTRTNGSGRFALAADGQSFTGSWSASADPNAVSGTWTGTRASSGSPPPVPSSSLGKERLRHRKLTD